MNNKHIAKILEIALNAGQLKRVVRTGWQKKDIKYPESVAEHSYRVTILAMLLAPNYGVDQEKIMKMALIHDLGESVIGDLIWEKGGKVIGSQKDKHADEAKALEDIFGGEINEAEYLEIWKEYEEQTTSEAKLLKQIDKLEMVMQAYEYEKEGVSSERLQEFWTNAEKYLTGTQLEEVFKNLKELRKEIK